MEVNPFETLFEKISEIEERLNYQFKNKKNLVLAFIHRSFFNEYRAVIDQHNERLEFLGDSVLELIISDYVYEHLPTEPEGHLSNLRSYIVEASNCAQLALKLNIAEFILLGKGERMNDGRGREKIIADLFEALIGAIYKDGGLEATRRFFLHHFEERIKEIIYKPLRNWKAELQDYAQKKYQKPPIYKVLRESGPDHSKIFQVMAYLEDQEIGEGIGSSKKQAEQAAAENALNKLEIKYDD
ncbi:MAG: ribonuclease III [Chlamydiales bacterium]|jgi:ribonuclease-3|nr:ribonuclease III [Chlamydiales bacterium]